MKPSVEIRDFYLGESSNTADLNFVPGGIVSPDVAWNSVLIGDWSGTGLKNPCETEIFAVGQYQYALILADIAPGRGAAGFTVIERSSVIVPTLEKYSNDHRSHTYLIGHELGHSVFDLGHDSQFLSIMTTPSYRRTLSENRIGCDDLFQLGWPQHDRCDLGKLYIPDGIFTAISAGQYRVFSMKLGPG